jgi:DNA (cytosine-5)-methyltransferase 1
LRGLQPRVFVMENVSGMVKGKMKLIFVDILTELKASGYRVSARLLNAMYFGVPQSRERLIFVGVRDDLGIEPSHPTAETVPVTVGRALAGSNANSLRRMSERAGSIWGQLRPGESGRDIGKPNKDFSLHKLDSIKPCPTYRKEQTAGNGLMHWEYPRYLSVNESARVGAFPDGFAFDGAPSEATNRIGNSVPPLMMRAIARHIRAEILH